MNPDDWCPLHGAGGDVCDCRVEAERAVQPVRDLMAELTASLEAAKVRRAALDTLSRESQGDPMVTVQEAAAAVKAARRDPEPEPVPSPIYEEWV